MRMLFVIAALFLHVHCAPVVFAQENASGPLKIAAHHFASDSGKAIAMLYRKEDDFPKKPFRKISVASHEGSANIVFENIPHGEYALIVCHDENGNGTIDHNFLGIPMEPLGFSNGWQLSLFSGKPDFEKLKFTFDANTVEYPIEID